MSSALDEDTQRAIADGRETAGAMLRSAQKDLQKVFIVFLVGFLGTFYALRLAVWDFFRTVTERRMNELTAQSFDIIAQTPFDVILLQAKISLIAGIIVAIPIFIYFARDALRDRDMWPQSPVPVWKLASISIMAVLLFLLGMAYGYFVFFPFMFEFLAGNAVSAGFAPTWSIVMWAQFIFLLTMSFGLAAQMPLFITGLSYAEIVPYETFREKWRYAVVAIFVFGAVFSPPDPFTQIMWAVPLLFLYGFSLYLAKFAVTMRRGSERLDPRSTIVNNWNVLVGAFVLGGFLSWAFYTETGGGLKAANGLLEAIGSNYRFLRPWDLIPFYWTTDLTLIVVVAGLIFTAAAFLYVAYKELLDSVGADASGTMGDPTGIDLATLDEAGVRAAPKEAFEAMTEAEALQAAQAALDDDDHGKAQAILDRYDEANPEGEEAAAGDAASGGPPSGPVDDGGFIDEHRLGQSPTMMQTMVTMVKRGHTRIDWRRRYRQRWYVFLSVAAVGFAIVYIGITSQFGEWLNDVVIPALSFLGPNARVPNIEEILPLARENATLLTSLAAAVFAMAMLMAYYIYTCVRAGLDPAVFDLNALSTEEIRRAPYRGMRRLDQAEVNRAASKAERRGYPEKAAAIRERYESAKHLPEFEGVAVHRAWPLMPETGVLGRIRRGRHWVNWGQRFRERWNLLAVVGVLALGVGYAVVTEPAAVKSFLTDLGLSVTVPDLAATFGGETMALGAVVAGTILLLAIITGLFAFVISYLAGTDPTAIDVETLSTVELRRAPPAMFASMSEQRANFLADRALRAGDSDRASVLFERFDETQTDRAREEDRNAPKPGSTADRATRASGTFLDELTGGETDEDDIGGYYKDIAFIVDTLTSKTFRIVGVFMVVLASVFAWLYTGGIGDVYAGFLARVPGEVLSPGQTAADAAKVIALHPVEALIFEVKFSTLVAALVTIPLIAYYAWPALRERGFVRGHRNIIFGWVTVLVIGLFAGLALGYLYVAPAVISYLVADALAADMIISYRISDFFWLIFFTTAGIGFLFDIPVLMVLLNTVGISYQSMRSRWREVTIGIMLAAALFTPADVITMFLVTIPLMAAYGVGIGVLFVLTLGGRRNLRKPVVQG